MNRAKREALLLGEPLPLPYKVIQTNKPHTDNIISSKKLPQTDANPASDPFRKIVVGKIRERQISAEINRLSQEIEAKSSLDSVICDKNRKLASISRIVLLLRLIEARLPTLDTILAEYAEEKLTVIELQLDRLLLELGETPELNDLENARQKTDQIETVQSIKLDTSGPRNHQLAPNASIWSVVTTSADIRSIWLISTAVVIFFISSYAVSGLTYDYCYYFC